MGAGQPRLPLGAALRLHMGEVAVEDQLVGGDSLKTPPYVELARIGTLG